MSEEKKKNMTNAIKAVNALQEDKQNYILGYMNGIMDAEKLRKKEPEKG